MARYAVTEQPDGDLLIHFTEGDKRIIARREYHNQMPSVALEGSRYTSKYGAKKAMIQVSFMTYRREDGQEIHGSYLGMLCELLEP